MDSSTSATSSSHLSGRTKETRKYKHALFHLRLPLGIRGVGKRGEKIDEEKRREDRRMFYELIFGLSRLEGDSK